MKTDFCTTAIVILNYNGRHYLEQFLPSVISHKGDASIWVADNASTDDSIFFLKTHFSEVKIIHLPQNYGFAKGYNLALKQIEATYYVLLNSDVEVTQHWLTPQIELLENNTLIAACQPKVLDFHKKTYFEYAGAGGGFLDFLGYPFCRGRVFDAIEIDTAQYNDVVPIFWASGACMVVRSSAFWVVGGFDDDFFAHMEEIDFCWRIHKAGLQVWYNGNASVFHVGGGTLHKSNPQKTFLNFRNGLAMLYKNHPPKRFFRNIFYRLVLDGMAGMKFLINGSFSDCFAIVKAHVDCYLHYQLWHSKRRKIQQKYDTKNSIPLAKYSVVWQFFGKGKQTFPALDKPNPKH